MPLISAVVPIHDVEPYLAECLQSIASQTHRDLEVVMVDDGSTDASAEVAAHFAACDSRFRLISQPNGGLSRARNAGARAATGEFLAFVDSDDLLPHDAYERLHQALAASGSDFASGNVRRLTARGAEPAPFLASTFAQTRMATHVTRCRPLLADRTAWNKLFRRSFWDAHGFAFPEGRVHEDIPVMLPAHFAARSVDVLSAPVYLWRRRDDGTRSITQRRLEHRVMRDRLTAIEEVRAFLAAGGHSKVARWYDERLVTDDLRLHVELLHEADPEYRHEFMTRTTVMLETLPARVFRRLPAVQRLQWHLLRRGLADEAAEVGRFAAEEAATTPPIRRRGRYYGDYPYRTDPEMKLPRSLYRLGRADAELALAVTLERVGGQQGALTIGGHAHIVGLGAADRGGQRVIVGAVRKGRWSRVRRHLRPLRAATIDVYRPDLIAQGRRRLAWAGFEGRFEARQLTGSSSASYEVFVHVRSGLVVRRRARFDVPGAGLLPAIHLPDTDGVLVRAAVSAAGSLTLDVRTRWLRLDHARGESGRIALSGAARLGGCSGTLELRRRSDQAALGFPLEVRGDRFQAALLTEAVAYARPPLEVEAAPRIAPQQVWELWAVVDGRTYPVALPAQVHGAMWTSGDRELLLVPTPDGHATLVERDRIVPVHGTRTSAREARDTVAR